MELYIGRQSVKLFRRGLCSVVSSVGDMVNMLVMWLISFMMFTFAWSLARRLRSVALLRNVLTSLWTVFVQY